MDSMPQDEVLSLGTATVALQPGNETRRFRVHSASFKVLPGRRRVRIWFEGPEGSVAVEMSRTTFWHLTALWHERSIAADNPSTKQRPTRRKRS